jgi:hypothetical protein
MINESLKNTDCPRQDATKVFVESSFVMRIFNDNFWLTFWPGFWGNFLADLLVGVVIVWVIQRWITARNRSELQLIGAWNTLEDGTYQIKFVIRNIGRTSFGPKEIYWNLYADRDFLGAISAGVSEEQTTTFHQRIVTIGNVWLQKYGGLIDAPIFPGREIYVAYWRFNPAKGKTNALYSHLTQTLKARSAQQLRDDDLIPLYYALSTTRGLFPRDIKYNRDIETYGRVKLVLAADYALLDGD